jgi:hypothetical protein
MLIFPLTGLIWDTFYLERYYTASISKGSVSRTERDKSFVKWGYKKERNFVRWDGL